MLDIYTYRKYRKKIGYFDIFENITVFSNAVQLCPHVFVSLWNV